MDRDRPLMMSTFYQLGIAIEVPHWIFQNVRGDTEWQTLDVDGPEALAGRLPLLTIECEHVEPMPDYFKSGSKSIVTDGFRRICERFECPAEFLAIKVLDPTGQQAMRSPFWFMHLLERLDCIDQEQSQYQAWSSRPDSEFRRLERLVFRDDAIGHRDLFKPKRYSQLFVSGRLRAALLEGDCVVHFTPSDDVRL